LAYNLQSLVESGESGKLPLKFVGFAKFARPPSKLNSTAISENLPLRRWFKITLGKTVLSTNRILPYQPSNWGGNGVNGDRVGLGIELGVMQEFGQSLYDSECGFNNDVKCDKNSGGSQETKVLKITPGLVKGKKGGRVQVIPAPFEYHVRFCGG
jgi:hypothetical protein